jgi:hypothetical protein
MKCHRVIKRLLRAEKLIGELLRAWDNSEMSNVVQAIDELRDFMAEV